MRRWFECYLKNKWKNREGLVWLCLKWMASFNHSYRCSFGVSSGTASEASCLQTQPFHAHTAGTLQTKQEVSFVVYLDINLLCAIKCHKFLYHTVCQSDDFLLFFSCDFFLEGGAFSPIWHRSTVSPVCDLKLRAGLDYILSAPCVFVLSSLNSPTRLYHFRYHSFWGPWNIKQLSNHGEVPLLWKL